MSGGETILVVEDNRDIRSFVNSALTTSGYTVIEAATGWQALQKAEGAPPDALLLDWQLPDITGLDVLRALRSGGCKSPAILMTGYGSEELAMLALRLGARDYLIKPFSPDELFQAVETALAETRLRRERNSLQAQLTQAVQWRDKVARQLTIARSYLYRLALLTEGLKLNREENWAARIEEAQSHIRKIAEVIRALSSSIRK
jgi:sigma-B regulation protein RsbU (phosphoserine phosphatase)